MAAKFTRRLLFARPGACLAGLWACRRGSAPAATRRIATIAYRSPQATTLSLCTYDYCGRPIEQRHCRPLHSGVSSLPPWPRKICVWREGAG
jgi:hypothetical protein